jgi:hypothetical protein
VDCDHRGTIWAIDIPDCPNAPCPCGYECTRCGRQWTEDPRGLAAPADAVAVDAAEQPVS